MVLGDMPVPAACSSQDIGKEKEKQIHREDSPQPGGGLAAGGPSSTCQPEACCGAVHVYLVPPWDPCIAIPRLLNPQSNN